MIEYEVGKSFVFVVCLGVYGRGKCNVNAAPRTPLGNISNTLQESGEKRQTGKGKSKVRYRNSSDDMFKEDLAARFEKSSERNEEDFGMLIYRKKCRLNKM